MAVEPELLRVLDPTQRLIFAQFAFKTEILTTSDLRGLINLSDRTVPDRLRSWIEQGFLVPKDAAEVRVRSCTLAPAYKKFAEQIRAEPERYQYLLV